MATHSEALLEAYAACPPSARVYHTLEIWQSSFAEPARIRAARSPDGRHVADRQRDGTQPARQALSAAEQELRLHSVSEPVADMSDRAAFLAPLIGEQWAWQSHNCWDFACHV
jgi:hypothetical protein